MRASAGGARPERPRTLSDPATAWRGSLPRECSGLLPRWVSEPPVHTFLPPPPPPPPPLPLPPPPPALTNEELRKALTELDRMGRRGIRGLFDARAPRGLESGPLGLMRSEPTQVAAASALLADPLVWWPALDEQRRIDPQGEGFGWTRAAGLGTLAPLGETSGSGGEPLILSVLRWADLYPRCGDECSEPGTDRRADGRPPRPVAQRTRPLRPRIHRKLARGGTALVSSCSRRLRLCEGSGDAGEGMRGGGRHARGLARYSVALLRRSLGSWHLMRRCSDEGGAAMCVGGSPYPRGHNDAREMIGASVCAAISTAREC